MNRIFAVLVMVLFIGLSALPAIAAQPMGVHIEAPSTIDTSDIDTFTASGPAVDAGLLCGRGDVFELSGHVSGPPDGSFINLRVLKHFVCQNGSGTFDVRLVADVDKTTGKATGSWVVVDGTGDYVGVKGNGKLIGIPIEPGTSIQDIYDGRLH